MSSNYINELVRYAKMVQVYSPDGERILNILNKKIKDYSLDRSLLKRRNFWIELEGIFLKKENYVELERLKVLELSYKNYDSVYQLFSKNTYITKLSEWVTTLPKIESYVTDIMDYAISLDKFRYKVDEGRLTCSIDSLRFFNNIVEKNCDDSEVFKYLPLVIWTLENLFIYDKYSFKLNNFLKDSVIVYFKKHRQVSNEFYNLINRESEFVQEIDNFNLSSSSVFNTTENSSESYNCVYEDDINCDFFTSQLEAFLTDNSKSNIDLDNARYVRKNNPLYCIYRAYIFAIRLDCLDDWVYALPNKVVVSINQLVDIQLNTYSQDNIAYIILMNCRELLSLPEDSFERNLEMWDSIVAVIWELVENMVTTGLLTLETVGKIEDYLKSGREVIEVRSE